MEKIHNRKTYLDLLRIIAIIFVIFNHTGTRGFVLFTERLDTRLSWFYLFISILIKTGVPLFFMISGAVLLGKEESYKTLLKKRVLKYFLILVIASAGQYLGICLITKPQALSLEYFLRTLYSRKMVTAYWYLYAYLGYLLVLPLLRRLAKAMTARDYQWMILLFGFMKFLAIFEFLVWKGSIAHNSKFALFITADSVFFPLTGYYLEHVADHDKVYRRKTILLLTAASIIAISVCCVMTKSRCLLIGEWKESTCQTFFNTLIFIPTITLFVGAKMLLEKHQTGERTGKIITAAAETTFGVFLIENILRKVTDSVFVFLAHRIPIFLACWAWVLSAAVVGMILVFLLRLIPGVKKIL